MFKFTNREWSWAVYDFGNSAYALIVMTMFFPLFFAEYVVPGQLSPALWGGAVSFSILLVGLISPFLGAYADKETNRKGFFVLFSIIAIMGTIALPFTAYVPSYLGIFIFILVNSAFGLSLFLYDSFIIAVVHEKKVSTTLSGIGWAIGYIGGPLCLLIAYLLMGMKLPTMLKDYQTLFVTTGLFFLFCSVWPFRALPKDEEPPDDFLGLSAMQIVLNTTRSWRKMKHIFVFLLAMYFIMDGLTTIVYFVSLFAKNGLGFTIEEIVKLLVIVQVVGIFATAIMCWLAERLGEIRLLVFCSVIWVVIVFLMYFNTDYNAYFYISLLTGVVVGSTPAIARGFLGKIVPIDKRAELFGFNSFASRIATLMGPVIFGVVASSWNMKIALLTVIPFFAVGVIMLLYLGANFKRWEREGSVK